MHTIVRFGGFAMMCMASAALAGDDGFTPDGAATWSARSLLMSSSIEGARETGELDKHRFATACDGITGEQMHHEYGKVPRWALTSQLEICSAYDGYAGKFQGSKVPCRSLEKGLKDLEHANDPGVPAEVVNSARALTNTASEILEAARASKHGCKL